MKQYIVGAEQYVVGYLHLKNLCTIAIAMARPSDITTAALATLRLREIERS